jgi:hypothetical protein
MMALLQGAGLIPARGHGRVNGRDVDVSVLRGESSASIEAKIKAALAGRFGLMAITDGPVRTILVVDGAFPSGDAANAYAFTVTDFGQGQALAFGSSVGKLTAPAQALAYEGPARATLGAQLEVETQTAFDFGRAHTSTTLARLRGSSAALQATIGDALQAEGFAPLRSQGAEAPDAVNCWRRGLTVVSVVSQENEVLIHATDTP